MFLVFTAFWKWKESNNTVPYAQRDVVAGTQELKKRRVLA